MTTSMTVMPIAQPSSGYRSVKADGSGDPPGRLMSVHGDKRLEFGAVDAAVLGICDSP
jgi:hypothetical protein